ncbi:MAG TPA: serine/threonine-protein kinase, partial [Kofleriaceae bacterium]|nr:serine/threonine-protein kinase [Kofleriaceae bacterium]
IRHPGIVEIYDFGWTPDGAAFIVMERLEGETVGRRSARIRQRWPAVLATARQIAGALGAAHAKGIVHRDLKPDNVFLVPDPEVPGGERIKLLDFGIAKLAVDSTTSSNVTKTGAVMGTPTYMAPEQCRGVAVDHRADLYSLGCVIYELCCGRPPFVGEGSGDVLAAHIHLPVPPMAGQGAEVPAAVEQLVMHLLAKAPADRVQSADELIRAIDAVTADRAAVSSGPRRAASVISLPSVTTLSGSASTSMLLPRARRRRWPIAAFSVGLAAITVIVVALVMRRGDEAPVIASHPADPPSAPSAPAQPTPVSPLPTGAAAAPSPRPPPPGPPSQPVPSGVAGAPREEQPPAHAGPPAAAPASTPPGAPPAVVSADRPAEPAPAPAAAPPSTGPAAVSADRPAEPAPAPAPAADKAPDAPRTVPRLRSTAGAPREPAPHASGPADTIEVEVDSAPRGAQVVLDGNVLGTTPYHHTLPRRDRDVKLVLRLAGYADRIVVARGSQPIIQSVTLRKAAPPATKNSKTDRDRSVNPF